MVLKASTSLVPLAALANSPAARSNSSLAATVFVLWSSVAAFRACECAYGMVSPRNLAKEPTDPTNESGEVSMEGCNRQMATRLLLVVERNQPINVHSIIALLRSQNQDSDLSWVE